MRRNEALGDEYELRADTIAGQRRPDGDHWSAANWLKRRFVS
jgi:hypothetical protein